MTKPRLAAGLCATNGEASALVVVLTALARVRRVLGLLAGLLAATLLLARLLLAAALLVLTTLAGILRVLRILWILVHATLSPVAPAPIRQVTKRRSPSKSSIYLNITDTLPGAGVTTLQCASVFNLSQIVEMELSCGEYCRHMMSQLWPARLPAIGDIPRLAGWFPSGWQAAVLLQHVSGPHRSAIWERNVGCQPAGQHHPLGIKGKVSG
jgi:hypothetical protein